MKKNYFKFSSLALIAGMCVIASCDNDDDPIVNPDDSSTLHGAVTSDLTLESGKTYTLDGELIVKAGATLNIEEGVTVVSLYDDKVDYIIVEQGAKINAVGTASSPIVMTSQKEEPGAWGGIHICGFARTNAEGVKGSSEIGGATYGGDKEMAWRLLSRYVSTNESKVLSDIAFHYENITEGLHS